MSGEAISGTYAASILDPKGSGTQTRYASSSAAHTASPVVMCPDCSVLHSPELQLLSMKNRLGGVVRCAAALTLMGSALVLSAQEGLRDRDPTFAESKKIANALNQSWAHSGPFYLLSHIQIPDLGYSDEIYLPLAATSRGLSFAASAPQRLYFVPQRKTVYSIEVVPSYAWIQRNQTAYRGGNQLGWTARADAQYLLNHLYLDLYGIGANHLRNSSPEIDRVVTERNRQIGAKGEIKYSTRTSLLFTAAHQSSRYPLDRF